MQLPNLARKSDKSTSYQWLVPRSPALRFLHVIACQVVIAMIMLPVIPTASADIYKYVDKDGVIHLADRRLGPGYRRILISPAPKQLAQAVTPYKAFRKPEGRVYEGKKFLYHPLITQAASRHKVDPALVHAVIKAESGYQPEAISRAGAVGLMQLMPGTASRYGVKDRRDPQDNINGGVRYLKDLLLRFQNLTLALAAYNAGENAVTKYGNRIPPYPETQQYVRKVLDYYLTYRGSSEFGTSGKPNSSTLLARSNGQLPGTRSLQ